MNLIERIEQNKRDITRMKQEAYLRGRKEQEQQDSSEILSDLKEFELKRYSDMNRTLKSIRAKWEKRL